MSENTPENETAAPVQEAAVTEEAGNMGSGCGQFDGTAQPLSEPAATALMELSAHAAPGVHAVRNWSSKKKEWKYEPCDAAISLDLIRQHLSSEGPHLGLYPIAPGEGTTRFAAFDLDDHDGGTGWEAIAEAARRLVAGLSVLGCHPLVFRSGGGSGIHIFLFWSEPQTAKDVRKFMAEMLSQHGFKAGTAGVGKGEIEVFPKQDTVKAGGRGNLIALPLARRSSPLHPTTLQETATWSLRHSPAATALATSAEVRSALMAITDDPYDRWIAFAFAIKGEFESVLPDDGYDLWREWSARNPAKFDEREGERKWRALSPQFGGEGNVTIATILWTATHEYGWRAPKDKKSGPAPETVRALLDGAVYCFGVKRFVDLATLTAYDKEAFSDKHAVDFPLGMKRPTAATTFINHPDGRKVHSPTYLPGGENFVTWEKLLRINLWTPTTLVRQRGDVTPFLEHAAYILPNTDELRIVLDWMAYTVQRPGEKINWAIFLGGRHGIGKDSLFVSLIRAVGDHNTSIIKAEDTASSFTDWLERKLIIVEEMAAFGKREVLNNIKPLLSSPPDKVRINQKFEKPYYVPNIGNYVFFSNQQDALPIEPGERRYYICWSPAEPRPHAYYDGLHAWLDANSGAVYDWLMDRDISAFPAKGRAPETEARAAMIKDTRTPLEQYMAARIEEAALPFDRDIITVAQVIKALPSYIRNPSDVKVAEYLKACGAIRLQKQAQMPDRSGRPAVWALRHAEKYAEMTPTQLGKLLIGEHINIEQQDGDTTKVVQFRQPGTETVF